MLGPEGILIDFQRSLVERFRLGVTALLLIELSKFQVVDATSSPSGPCMASSIRRAFFVEQLRLSAAADLIVNLTLPP